MNEKKYMDSFYKELPDMSFDFKIEVVGKITGTKYFGEFSSKIPNTKDQCLIAKHKAFLNGEYAEYLAPGALKTHEQLAYLRYTLTDSPKFWKHSDLGYELIDSNVVESIYDKVIELENNWLKQVWGEDKTEETKDESGSSKED